MFLSFILLQVTRRGGKTIKSKPYIEDKDDEDDPTVSSVSFNTPEVIVVTDDLVCSFIEVCF
jgi:hypothetical protein